MSSTSPIIEAKPGRFSRLESIEWWDQTRLAQARILVAGAGALGNEVIKNLALLGVGHLVIADMDHIELSNLSRSVLFREADEGKPKAARAAEAARQLYPAIHASAVQGNLLAEVGLGYFRWADVVVGALDNREARVFLNSACARVGRPWIDGGIEVLQGIVRGFAPPASACYECTMSQVDWDLLNKRRSCSLLARRAVAERGVPTTPTTASIIAALQVQEVVKWLHGMEAMVGRGLVFEGASNSSFAVNYPIHPECPWHEPACRVVANERLTSDVPLRQLWTEAQNQLDGAIDALDLSRELVRWLTCPSCGRREQVLQPAEKIDESRARCARCQSEMTPEFLHSISAQSDLLDLTPAKIGLPPWDIVWARNVSSMIGLEIAGDKPSSLV